MSDGSERAARTPQAARTGVSWRSRSLRPLKVAWRRVRWLFLAGGSGAGTPKRQRFPLEPRSVALSGRSGGDRHPRPRHPGGRPAGARRAPVVARSGAVPVRAGRVADRAARCLPDRAHAQRLRRRHRRQRQGRGRAAADAGHAERYARHLAGAGRRRLPGLDGRAARAHRRAARQRRRPAGVRLRPAERQGGGVRGAVLGQFRSGRGAVRPAGLLSAKHVHRRSDAAAVPLSLRGERLVERQAARHAAAADPRADAAGGRRGGTGRGEAAAAAGRVDRSEALRRADGHAARHRPIAAAPPDPGRAARPHPARRRFRRDDRDRSAADALFQPAVAARAGLLLLRRRSGARGRPVLRLSHHRAVPGGCRRTGLRLPHHPQRHRAAGRILSARLPRPPAAAGDGGALAQRVGSRADDPHPARDRADAQGRAGLAGHAARRSLRRHRPARARHPDRAGAGARSCAHDRGRRRVGGILHHDDDPAGAAPDRKLRPAGDAAAAGGEGIPLCDPPAGRSAGHAGGGARDHRAGGAGRYPAAAATPERDGYEPAGRRAAHHDQRRAPPAAQPAGHQRAVGSGAGGGPGLLAAAGARTRAAGRDLVPDRAADRAGRTVAAADRRRQSDPGQPRPAPARFDAPSGRRSDAGVSRGARPGGRRDVRL